MPLPGAKFPTTWYTPFTYLLTLALGSGQHVKSRIYNIYFCILNSQRMKVTIIGVRWQGGAY